MIDLNQVHFEERKTLNGVEVYGTLRLVQVQKLSDMYLHMKDPKDVKEEVKRAIRVNIWNAVYDGLIQRWPAISSMVRTKERITDTELELIEQFYRRLQPRV